MNLSDVDPAAPEGRALRTLFRAYLHQDLVDEYGDMRSTVLAYRAAAPQRRDEVVAEIERLLDGFSEEKSLAEAVRGIGPAYYPPAPGGPTGTGWTSSEPCSPPTADPLWGDRTRYREPRPRRWSTTRGGT